MLFCGIKLTHDAAVSVVADGELMFSIELEKLPGGRRYAEMPDLSAIDQILASERLRPTDVDEFIVDGWGWEPLADGVNGVVSTLAGQPVTIELAPYIWGLREAAPLRAIHTNGPSGSVLGRGYTSFSHVMGHVLASYCSSPFAQKTEDAFVLAWDGGMLPQLYEVHARSRSITSHGPLLSYVGNAFAAFSEIFEPFRFSVDGLSDFEIVRKRLEIPGKAMAFGGLGTVDTGLFSDFRRLWTRVGRLSVEDGFAFGKAVLAERAGLRGGLSDADFIASFQAFLGGELTRALARFLEREGRLVGARLCLAGGCGLNIKWNSEVREAGLFEAVWVPPFTNDSGNALGAACCGMFVSQERTSLTWNPYSGPNLATATSQTGWRETACGPAELGRLLYQVGEPVVVLSGRSELGPRALGNRSILSPAISSSMRDKINDIKGRESYRPVAPVCLVESSTDVFDPGGEDPFMLFDHIVRDSWKAKIPAVVHADGTARLQSIGLSVGGSVTHDILKGYYDVSGIPVLCNTSANRLGGGFFSSANEAMSWGRVSHVWSDGRLFIKM